MNARNRAYFIVKNYSFKGELYGIIIDGTPEAFFLAYSKTPLPLVPVAFFIQQPFVMAKITRLFKSVYRLVLPLVVLLVLAVGASSVWLVHETAHPLTSLYLVTPEKYGLLSARGAKVTDENWTNRDSTRARGWLLRGTPGAPAVVLLHRYGADRSHVLDLGVKLNETTNYTILMPDQRGHGPDPLVKYSSFGGCESDDTSSAIAFLRSLQTPEQAQQVGDNIGVYGLEMGAIAALAAAADDPSIKGIALDSVPKDADTMLAAAIDRRFPFASGVTSKFAQLGTRGYFYEGCYREQAAQDLARNVADRHVLLLSGVDAPQFQESTLKLSKGFPSGTFVAAKNDLSPSGFGILSASMDVAAAYDQRIIDFFRTALGNGV
ncbi:MAG: alpha/beta fold hydrolase [Pyrinomonadaceae bacterium]